MKEIKKLYKYNKYTFIIKEIAFSRKEVNKYPEDHSKYNMSIYYDDILISEYLKHIGILSYSMKYVTNKIKLKKDSSFNIITYDILKVINKIQNDLNILDSQIEEYNLVKPSEYMNYYKLNK